MLPQLQLVLVGHERRYAVIDGELLAAGDARWRGHVAIEARILQLQARHPLGRAHVIRAADRRQRVQVQAVRDAPGHHVDPAVGHRQFATVEVEFERARVGADVPPQLALQRGEGREEKSPSRQSQERPFPQTPGDRV